MLPTHLIIADGTVLETEVGFCQADAVEFIWTGEYLPRGPEGWQIYAIGFEPGLVSTSNDVTDVVARDLLARTYDRQDTPAHVGRWLEWMGLEPFRMAEAA